MSELNPTQTKLIDAVPGFENSGPEATVIQPGQPVAGVAPGEFRGDPRRVVGHPLNEASAMNFGELFRKEQAAAHAGEAAVEQAVDAAGLITEMPEHLRANQ